MVSLLGTQDRMTPYSFAIDEARTVMHDLIIKMTECDNMKLFKNIAAVYVVWQHEIGNLQLEELNWRLEG